MTMNYYNKSHELFIPFKNMILMISEVKNNSNEQD